MRHKVRLFPLLTVLTTLLFSNVAAAADIADLRQWMVNRMKSAAPPGRSLITGAKETPEDGLQRYGEIADSVIAVAYDPAEPPAFPGKRGRAKTAALILSIALYESAYRKDVDLNIGSEARGDGGRSWCMMQVQLGRPTNGKTPYRIVLTKNSYEFTQDQDRGLGGEELISDRRNCFRAGIRMAAKSFLTCRKNQFLDRLSSYTAGNCDDEDGKEKSRLRVGKAVAWVHDYPPPLDDVAALALLQPPRPTTAETVSALSSKSPVAEAPKIVLVTQ